ncbi:MAG: polysaccharide lyase family protein [Verrucomicrobiota bacterium]
MKQNILALPFLSLLVALFGGSSAPSPAAESTAPVTLRETDRTFFLDNGILNVRIEKETGEIFSIKYQGQEMLAQDSSGGALGGYWSSVGRARGGGQLSAVVRINPKDNNGERVEVSCNFHNAPGSTNSPLDVDVRYSLGRGESWIYTYLVWAHKPGYPGFGVGEARYAAKLNPAVFDYMTIDNERRRQMPTGADWDAGTPLNLKEARRMTTGIHKGHAEHKYDYSALIYEIPAYGWSSTKYNLGFWFINPSFEYMAGGPTKAELTGHLDVNPGGTPTLLNMWLGSHYGGSAFSVGEDEDWTKVIGPFAIYCNTAPTHEAMWRDALARARTEAGTWPYNWVSDPHYPREAQRSTVSGQIVLRDPLDPGLKISNVWVGLTAPNYIPPRTGGGTNLARRNFTNAPAGGVTNFPGSGLRGGFPAEVDWQRDAKFYQFWIAASANGKFIIPNVRAGTYTLRAIADGVIGELALTNIVVTEGETKQLGALTWTPARYGRTLWQIGVPDRTAREFRHGDHYWQWGLYFNYAKDFPNDVNYIVGRSDWRKDWNYVQPPRLLTKNLGVVGEDDDVTDTLAQFVRATGREVQPTTWSIKFGLSQAPRGKATLRLAFCGTHAGCNVEVIVNDQPIGDTGTLPSTSAMQRDGIRAFWIEKPLSFDAALLKSGVNVIKLKSRANTWSQGVMYDVVRLELDEL